MKNLILVGAGDWGCEVYSWINHAIQHGEEYVFKGFIDDNLNALDDKFIDSKLLLGSIRDYSIDIDDVFICVIANISYKEKAVELLKSKGANFVNAIHKSSIFFNNVKLGVGVVLSPYTIVSNNCIIGDHVSINLFCSIGHDVSIGDFCQLSSHCDLTGRSQIAKNVMLGSRVTLLPKVTVVSNTVIGAGSVVFRKIKVSGTYVGNPSKQIL